MQILFGWNKRINCFFLTKLFKLNSYKFHNSLSKQAENHIPMVAWEDITKLWNNEGIIKSEELRFLQAIFG